MKREDFIQQLFSMIHCLEGNILVTGDEVSGNDACCRRQKDVVCHGHAVGIGAAPKAVFLYGRIAAIQKYGTRAKPDGGVATEPDRPNH